MKLFFDYKQSPQRKKNFTEKEDLRLDLKIQEKNFFISLIKESHFVSKNINLILNPCLTRITGGSPSG
jgi:hypothetical protein